MIPIPTKTTKIEYPTRKERRNYFTDVSRIPVPTIEDRIKPTPIPAPRRPQRQVRIQPPALICEPCAGPSEEETEVFHAGQSKMPFLYEYPIEEEYDEEEDFETPECVPCKKDDHYNLQWRQEQLNKISPGEGASRKTGYLETVDPNVLAMCRNINLRHKPPELQKVKKKLRYYI